MRRREFIAGLGAAASAGASPRTGWGQQSMPVVGYLSSRAQQEEAEYVDGFRDGLKRIGFVDGGNLTIVFRWADNDNSRLPTLAADLVRRRVAAIASVGGIPGTRAAKVATTTIPIVFFTGADPVKFGLVASLSRPGGNVTGVSALSDEVGPKRLEIMHELLPAAAEFAMLVDPTNPNSETQSSDMLAASRILGLSLHILNASNAGDLAEVFARALEFRAAALIIGPVTFLASVVQNRQLAALAARHAMPTISFARQFTTAGGLISYGSGNVVESYRLVGTYVGRILKGEKPSDLPVQLETRIELAINMKTAKALGLTFPLNLLGRADEVIE